MGFVLPHLLSQVDFALDEPAPPCTFFFFFFSWFGGVGRYEGKGFSLNITLQ